MSGWKQALLWEARLVLALSTPGLLVALHVPARLYQALVALFTLQFGDVVTLSTPFDFLHSPFPVFPLVTLAFWLQGAMLLLWLKPLPETEGSSFSADSTTSKGNYRDRIEIAAAIGVLLLTLALGWWERSAQLLPDASGRLPASNYDEMVYYSGAALLAQGHVPYRDFFLAHPPGAELLYALLLKLGGAANGFNSFLLARWGVIALGLLTALGAFWAAGRMWRSESKSFAIWPGVAAALLYAADGLTSSVATLETPANVFAILALGCYFEADHSKNKRSGLFLWPLCGALVAFSILCKLPGVALLFALGVYIIYRKQWRPLFLVALGFIAAVIVVMGPVVLLAKPGEVLRQMVFFQALRPQEVEAGLDQIGRIADYPGSVLIVFLAACTLTALAVNLIRGRVARTARWLIPVLWSFPMMALLILNKSFHPWYYVQWALPLALLGAGLASGYIWRIRWSETSDKNITPNFFAANSIRFLRYGLLVVAFLGLLPLLLTQTKFTAEPKIDRVYYPAGNYLKTQSGQSAQAVLVFDPGYSFMAGLKPARLPFDNKFLVDSAGYMVYLNLDIDRRGLLDLVGAVLNDRRERGQVDTIFKQERAQALVVEGVTQAGWTALDGKLALPQLTPRSVEFIQTPATQSQAIDYVTLYRLRQWDSRHPWLFNNGLWLTPFGLSTSQNGRANADTVAPGEVLGLKAKEAGQRTLDVRFTWRVKRTPAQTTKVFVHVLDATGKTVAQRDILPLDGKADTRNWKPGDAFEDVHSLPLPANLPPGRYTVEAGLYDAVSGERFTADGKGSLVIGYLDITA
ncbi:MAG TPA: hypothetical protein VH186_02995 [Chloroflexia bacterium]|nr:hypothetical protein [Chloroflexia bacterium]